MKDLILDEFSQTEIRKQLEPNEIVIWEGRPYNDGWDGSFILIGGMSFLPFLFFIETIGDQLWWFLLILLTVMVFYGKESMRKYLTSKKTKYLITKQRVVFQFYESGKKQFLFIPFDEIENVTVYKEVVNFKNGEVVLNMKERKTMTLIFYNRLGEVSKRPTLELIENVEEVASYIKMGIQNKL